MSKKSAVQFHFLKACTLSNRVLLKKFIVLVFKKEGVSLAGLDIIFCDDAYLLELNRQFLQHDFYTDILSFPLSGINEPLQGEIYISIPRVRDNAKDSGSSFQTELHRVIFHGLLHFCGYKDKTKADLRKMRSMEDKYLMAYL